MRRRKWISLPLCLCLAAALCGCGGRAAAPEAPAAPAPAALTAALPAPTAETSAAPELPEAPALPANRAEALAALGGDWVSFYDRLLTGEELTLRLEPPAEAELRWAGELPAALSDGRTLTWDGGIPLLAEADGSRVWVRAADYDLYLARHFAELEADVANVSDWLGDYVRAGAYRDDASLAGYLFRSAAVARGLVYLGCRDFRLTASYADPAGELRYFITEPYLLAVNNDGTRLDAVEEAEGRLFYVRADWVAENRLADGSGDDRLLVLRDGARLRFVNGWFSLVDADYADFLY